MMIELYIACTLRERSLAARSFSLRLHNSASPNSSSPTMFSTLFGRPLAPASPAPPAAASAAAQKPPMSALGLACVALAAQLQSRDPESYSTLMSNLLDIKTTSSIGAVERVIARADAIPFLEGKLAERRNSTDMLERLNRAAGRATSSFALRPLDSAVRDIFCLGIQELLEACSTTLVNLAEKAEEIAIKENMQSTIFSREMLDNTSTQPRALPFLLFACTHVAGARALAFGQEHLQDFNILSQVAAYGQALGQGSQRLTNPRSAADLALSQRA